MRNKNMTHQKILEISTVEFLDFLESEFTHTVPLSIESSEEAKECGALLAILSNQYNYLVGLLGFLKAQHRIAKGKGEYLGDLIDKRDAVSNKAAAIKLQYQAVSRIYTIRQDILAELRMSDYRA